MILDTAPQDPMAVSGSSLPERPPAQVGAWLDTLRAGNRESVEALPDEFLCHWRARGTGATALHVAAASGAHPASVLPILLARGLSLSDTTQAGKTPLEYTVSNRTDWASDWVACLLAAGDPIDNGHRGMVVATCFLTRKRLDMVEMLVRFGLYRMAEPEIAHRHPEEAFFNRDPDNLKDMAPVFETVRRLLPHTQASASQLLYRCIQRQRWSWAEYALAEGGNLCVQNPRSGRTLLHSLASHFSTVAVGSPNQIQILHLWLSRVLGAGLDPDAQDASGRTPSDLLEQVIRGVAQDQPRARLCQDLQFILQARRLERSTAPAQGAARARRL